MTVYTLFGRCRDLCAAERRHYLRREPVQLFQRLDERAAETTPSGQPCSLIQLATDYGDAAVRQRWDPFRKATGSFTLGISWSKARLVEATMLMGISGVRDRTPDAASLPCLLPFGSPAMQRSCRSRPHRDLSETPKRHARSRNSAGFHSAGKLPRHPHRLEFPAGRTTDLESVETLVAHLISPIRFRQGGCTRQ
jgi:hypothetical protein